MKRKHVWINWNSKVMMTAVGVIVAGSSTMSVAAQAMPMQPDPISKSQQILDASKFIQGLNDSCGTGNTGGKVQEAQFYPFGNYFNNWANWNNWGNFNQWQNQ